MNIDLSIFLASSARGFVVPSPETSIVASVRIMPLDRIPLTEFMTDNGEIVVERSRSESNPPYIADISDPRIRYGTGNSLYAPPVTFDLL